MTFWDRYTRVISVTPDEPALQGEFGKGLHCLPIHHYFLHTTSRRQMEVFKMLGRKDRNLTLCPPRKFATLF